MQSKATTVKQYLASLPADRRAFVAKIRDVVNANLPKGFEEGMQYGMIGWHVPHSAYPDGYHCDPKQPVPFAGLASQKNYVSLYLMCTYAIDEERERLIEAWTKTGKRLDMGKSCIRLKKLEDVPLDVIGKTIKRVSMKKFLAQYDSVIKAGGKSAKAKPAKKAAKKKAAKRG